MKNKNKTDILFTLSWISLIVLFLALVYVDNKLIRAYLVLFNSLASMFYYELKE